MIEGLYMMETEVKTISFDDSLEIIYRALYLPAITDYIESLIIAYVDAYHLALNECLKTESPSYELQERLQLLSGPINEVFNPNNTRLQNGQKYPAVELILSKINSYGAAVEKSFTRTLNKPNTPSIIDDGKNMGFSDIFFIIIITMVTAIFLGYVVFLLK